MACFIAPAVEAVVMTAVQKHVRNKEAEELKVYTSEEHVEVKSENKISWSRKLMWLNGMLWGGAALLLFEHVWHGEITAAFPFLTAVAEGNTLDMLKEIAITGGAMAVTITAIWAGVCYVVEKALAKQDSKIARLLEK